tara:strand:- start:2503 stop:3456 length:954 start_codon:yes stop_codon:yes gene_type:complete
LIKHKNNYCIVGFGNHAKTKLLPALLKLGKPILGIVSSKKNLDLPYDIFKTINDALKQSNEKTIFVVSSPPKEHYQQIKLLLKFRKNILIEKPIFIHPREVKLTEQYIKNTDVIVAEMLMYKFTNQYKKFIKFWNKKKKQCNKIECYFNIPEISSGTFRNSDEITSSSLYDVGSYLFSLLVDLKLYPLDLEITKIKKRKNKFLKFFIKGSHKHNIDIYLEFGFGNQYHNSVKIHYLKNYIASFDKFFYGRDGEKNIILQNNKTLKKITTHDINGFEYMFSKNNSYWKKNQKERFNKLRYVNNILYSLTIQLSSPRGL